MVQKICIWLLLFTPQEFYTYKVTITSKMRNDTYGIGGTLKLGIQKLEFLLQKITIISFDLYGKNSEVQFFIKIIIPSPRF